MDVLNLPTSLKHVKITKGEQPHLADIARGWHSINYWMGSKNSEVTREAVEKLIVFELRTDCRMSIVKRLIMKLNAIKREEFLVEIDEWVKKQSA